MKEVQGIVNEGKHFSFSYYGECVVEDLIKISENKSDINLIENIVFNYLLVNYFPFGHQVSPLKPLLD